MAAAAGAIEALTSIADLVAKVHDGLGTHRLGRKNLMRLLNQYDRRARYDGKLIDAASLDEHHRCDPHAADLFSAHVDLAKWLADNHFTISASHTKWYNFFAKRAASRRIPFWFAGKRSKELGALIAEITAIRERLLNDFKDYQISIPPADFHLPEGGEQRLRREEPAVNLPRADFQSLVIKAEAAADLLQA